MIVRKRSSGYVEANSRVLGLTVMSLTASGPKLHVLNANFHTEFGKEDIGMKWRPPNNVMPWGASCTSRQRVGNPGPGLGLPWAPVWHGAALVLVSQFWRGPVAVAWGGLQVGYQ